MNQEHSNNNKTLSYVSKLSLMAGSVSALALVPSQADAAVLYNDTNLSVSLSDSVGTTVDWDVDGDGSAEFVIHRSFSDWLGSTGIGIKQYNGQQQVPSFISPSWGTVDKLSIGDTVGSGNVFASGWSPVVLNNYRDIGTYFNGGSYSAEPFQGNQDEYMGFRFGDGAGGYNYGWANIFIDTVGGSFTIKEWAYDDSGAAITVGDKGVTEKTPESSSSLALLALGAAGVYSWRKRRQAATNTDIAA